VDIKSFSIGKLENIAGKYPEAVQAISIFTFGIAALIIIANQNSKPSESDFKRNSIEITAPRNKTEAPPAKQTLKPENKAVMNSEDRSKYRQFRSLRLPVSQKPDSTPKGKALMLR
jgi:hypothetical protein